MSKHIIHNGLTLFVLLVLTISSAAADTYTKVTSAAQLIPGASYLFVYENGDASVANTATLSGTTQGNLGKVAISISDNSFTAPNDAVPFVLGTSGSYYTFNFGTINSPQYLYYLSGNNSTDFAFSSLTSIAKWDITFTGEQIKIEYASNSNGHYIRYNFNAFKVNTNPTPIAIYLNTATAGTINTAPFRQSTAETAGNFTYWATFSNASNTFIAASNATAYKIGKRTHDDGSTIYLELTITPLTTQTVDGVSGYVIPANTGVFLKSTHNTSYSIDNPHEAESIKIPYLITSANSTNDNAFFADNLLHSGTGVAVSDNDYYFYKLSYSKLEPGETSLYDYTSLGFHFAVEGGHSITSNIGFAYLKLSTSDATPSPSQANTPSQFGIIDLSEETNTTTSIETISSREHARKIVRNGKIFIYKDGKVYDILGNNIAE